MIVPIEKVWTKSNFHYRLTDDHLFVVWSNVSPPPPVPSNWFRLHHCGSHFSQSRWTFISSRKFGENAQKPLTLIRRMLTRFRVQKKSEKTPPSPSPRGNLSSSKVIWELPFSSFSRKKTFFLLSKSSWAANYEYYTTFLSLFYKKIFNAETFSAYF